jgi:inorganic triphosphatase YgiF
MLKPGLGEGLPIELEATLIVLSDRPAAIAYQVADLGSLGSYHLIPQPDQTIHDEYFDTPDRSLASGHFGLRVRECGSDRYVTLKGQTTTPASGPVARFELELPWQRPNLHRIAAELTSRGIVLPGRIRQFDATAPAAVMRDLGLEPIQRRSTLRVRRNVVATEPKDAPVLAELAVDSVRYHLDTREVHLYEVEIEAADPTCHALLVTLSNRLIDQFAPALRTWPFSKLATGSAIAELDAAGAFEGHMHADGTLMTTAVDKIAAHFARHGSA